jgi:hypothetical protein
MQQLEHPTRVVLVLHCRTESTRIVTVNLTANITMLQWNTRIAVQMLMFSHFIFMTQETLIT